MSTTVRDWTITEPGVLTDMPHDVYLSDPVVGHSLSHSGAKTIVNKTPALFAWERKHGRANKTAFDVGHAAHQLVLGVGPEIVVVQKTAKDGAKSDADNYQTRSAQEHRDEIREAGAVPLLRDQLDDVTAMAAQIEDHPIASILLAPDSGQPEVSAFTRDPQTGVMLRCRFDWLRRPNSNGRLVLVDYKTTNNAQPDAFAKSAINYGYVMQGPWYCDVALALGMADDVSFVFVAQESDPPYLVNVIQLDVTADQIGRVLNRRAINTYAECESTGTWPGYPPAINSVSLPFWYEIQFAEDL